MLGAIASFTSHHNAGHQSGLPRSVSVKEVEICLQNATPIFTERLDTECLNQKSDDAFDGHASGWHMTLLEFFSAYLSAPF